MAYDPKEGGMRRPVRKPDPQDDTWAMRTHPKQPPAPKHMQAADQRQPRRTSALYDDFDSFYDRPIRQLPPRKARRKRHNVLWTLIFLILLCAELFIAFLMAPQLLGNELVSLDALPNIAFAGGTVLKKDAAVLRSYEEMMQTVDTDRLMHGITIDGVDVGGMTLSEARAAVEAV